MRYLGVFLWVLWTIPVWADEAPGRITVAGQGVISAAPDMATISVGVTQEAKLAVAALNATSEVTRRILASLQQAGVAAADMQTSNLNLGPQFSSYKSSGSDVPKIVGFVASNMISVRVRNLEDLGRVLDAVARDGANEFRGLQFGLQDPAPLENEARIAAVRDAMARAALYAQAAGVRLGRIISISEAGQVQPAMRMETMAFARDTGVPVVAGELDVRAEVTLVFAIDG